MQSGEWAFSFVYPARLKCLILRGVTDIPKRQGTLKQGEDYKKNTPIIVKDLLSILSQITFR